jgi:hypothetical protein
VSELNPTPDVPRITKTDMALISPSVKPATPDIILFDDAAIPIEFLAGLFFEQVGAQEIINIARNDIINGQNISYNLIANSSNLAETYNSSNMFRIPGTASEFFENFAIRFELYVPDGQDIVRISDRGDIVVSVSNFRFGGNDRVEVELLSAGILENDTIY